MAFSFIASPSTTPARYPGGSTVAPRWRDPVPLRLTRSGRAVVLEPAAGRFRWSADGRRQGSAAGATGGRVPPRPAHVLELLRRAVKSSRADGAGPLTARRGCRGLRASVRAYLGSMGLYGVSPPDRGSCVATKWMAARTSAGRSPVAGIA